MLKFILPLAILVFLFSSSCQRKSEFSLNNVDSTGGGVTTSSKLDLIKDSVYLYTKEVYLWSEVIPPYATFNPRQYSGATELATATNVLNGIRALQPLDRFSFVTTAAQSAGIQTGEDTDFGFMVKASSIDRALPIDSIYWFVSYAYTNSAAGKAGIQRGYRVTKINGTKIGYDNPSINILNSVLFGKATSATFEFTKSDNTVLAPITLNAASYVANSVLHRSVLTSGAKKVGYLVFNQFLGAPSRRELGDAFTFFQSQSISDLVVDLRYNPGGSTETQDTLANLIAPTSANKKTMYQYIFNTTLQQNKHVLIRKKGYNVNFGTGADNTQIFQKAGSLNLPRVFFIVGSGSASASELLINNLRPYMNVQLIGDTTYGKPVGFFPIALYDYAIYPISFKTVNSAGNADYYSGFIPNALAGDYVDLNWGDTGDASLATALKFITTGSYRTLNDNSTRETELRMNSSQFVEPIQKKLESGRFNGMFIENKK